MHQTFMTLQESIVFDAPVEAVWRLFADPERWARWNTEWAEIRDVRGPFDHAGSGYTQVLRVFRQKSLMAWVAERRLTHPRAESEHVRTAS
jgi:hypothetical protein